MDHVVSPSYIIRLAEQLREELMTLRRYFHQYPELSWEEAHTAHTIAEELLSSGLAVQTDVGGHGLIAQLTGKRPGPVVAYRADMDALPLKDDLDSPYRSVNLGVKHACGHDVHMAVAIGVAKVLSKLKGKFGGTLRFIFQPAEEALDGAQAMIAAGVLEKPIPMAMLALHSFPLPVGTIGLTPGCCLSGMEEYRVRFNASDEMLPVLIEKTLAALSGLSDHTPPSTSKAFDMLIQRMKTGSDQKENLYLSCWPTAAGSAGKDHIICLASMVNYAARFDVQRNLSMRLDAVIEETDASYILRTSFTNPPTINDTQLIKQLKPLVEDIVGNENVVYFNAPYPFAHEDFALYAQQVPAALLWLGTANHDRGIHSLLHSSDYDVDEDALVTGTATMSYLLLQLLQAAVMS